MKVKKKLLLSIFSLILSITVFSSVVFAWFTINSTTSDFIITTGNLEASVKLEAGKWSSEGQAYSWTEVKTQDQANEFFNIVPGQIITFRLTLTNKDTSTVAVKYNINFGKLTYCTDTSSPTYSYVETPGENHLYDAIFVTLSDPKTSNYSHEEIHNMKPYTDVTFVHTSDAKALRTYNNNNKAELVSNEQSILLGKNTSVEYIIKFYFDPTIVTGTPESSNHLMKKGFTFENIQVEFTQEHKVTE